MRGTIFLQKIKQKNSLDMQSPETRMVLEREREVFFKSPKKQAKKQGVALLGNQKTHQNNNKGITLLVLITTIIILLILAGVALSLVLGEEGIINRAITASKTYDISGAKEQVEFLVATYSGNYYEQKYTTGNESVEDSMVEYVIARFKENEGENIGEYDVSVDEDVKTVKITSTKDKENTATATIEDDGSVIWRELKFIATDKSYVGYYADLNGNGTVDGVIYADLAVGGSEKNDDSWGTYTIPNVRGEELRKYYVSQTNYDGPFGKKDVLSARGAGKDRFFVMSLKDITTNGPDYAWYSAGASNTMKIITLFTFGNGKTNTTNVMTKWKSKTYGEQDKNSSHKDLWGQIQDEVKNGWFVPSTHEWMAFAVELKITSSNYLDYGLRHLYWASSQHNATNAHVASFGGNCITNISASWWAAVRLSTTF